MDASHTARGNQSGKTTLVLKGIAIVSILVLAGALVSCSREDTPKKTESIRLGTVLLEPSLPVFIAESQGFFRKNGLKVTIEYYDVGMRAADGVEKSEVDLATPVAEYVLVGKIFAKKRIQAIASIDEVDYAYVVGRKDRGINAISDLKGKRIGVVRGTILDFQLGRFLDLSGMSIEEVELVNATLPQAADALVRGDIDAVMTIPPFIGTVQEKLGDNAILWPAQNSQPFYSLVLGKSEWIRRHPEAVERFLRAINDAEVYISQHPDEAKAALKKKLKFTDADVTRVWLQNNFSLSLDQALILAMEDEARWMMRNGLTGDKEVPDFADYVYEEGLKAFKPEAVGIIR
jgi:NitT/TauT family transport system substrate-binding protein